MKAAKLEVTGELELYSQEGGYADDAITVNDTHLSDIIKEHLTEKGEKDKWHSLWKFGKVRIVIEQIGEST